MKFFDWKAIFITYVESAAMIGAILLIVLFIEQLRVNLRFNLIFVFAFILFPFVFRFINLVFPVKNERRKKYAGTGRDAVAGIVAIVSFVATRDSGGSLFLATVIGIISWLIIYAVFGAINKKIFGEDI